MSYAFEPELSIEQMQRQDLVDSEVAELLNKLVPAGVHLEWNIEDIGLVRDAVFQVVHDATGMTAMEFYPYLKLVSDISVPEDGRFDDEEMEDKE